MKDQRFWGAILFGFVAAGAANLAVKLVFILGYGASFGPLVSTIADYAGPVVIGLAGGYVAAGKLPERRFLVAIVPFFAMWFFGTVIGFENGAGLAAIPGLLITLLLGLAGATAGAMARRSGLTSAST